MYKVICKSLKTSYARVEKVYSDIPDEHIGEVIFEICEDKDYKITSVIHESNNESEARISDKIYRYDPFDGVITPQTIGYQYGNI